MIFVEVTVVDPSDFEGRLHVRGEVLHERYRVMTVTAPSVPNALAALALRIRDDTGVHPAHLLRVDRGQPGPAVPAVPALRHAARSRR